MDNEPEPPSQEASPLLLERLREQPVPPPMLEARVVGALHADGLIRSGSAWSWPVKIAASLLIFFMGAIAGRSVPQEWFAAPRPAQSQPRYLLLLANDVTPATDGSSRAAEYGEWARSLAGRGIAVSGDELTSQAEIVANERGTTFPDLTSVGGYFLIEASDDASAAALARTCPHVKYGGSIVVRRLQ
jgi:hypothetical protein